MFINFISRKKNSLLLFPLEVVLVISIFSCRKDLFKEAVSVTTGNVSNIKTSSAEVTGTIVDLGNGISQYGHCWSEQSIPTVNDEKTTFNSPIKTGNYTSPLTGLKPRVKYYVRAWAKSGNEVTYGKEEVSFTTGNGEITLTTTAITNPTFNSAISGGYIADDGGDSIIARGVCWNTSPNPTIANYKTNDGNGTGGFTSNLIGLSPGITYYVRAFAINSFGTVYAKNELSFITKNSKITLTTTAISNPTENSATCGGNITDDGGDPVTVRGVCWNTSPNPTIANYMTNDGKGSGVFTSNLTGLSPGITYYVRAYAINSTGTTYAKNEVSFSTPTNTLRDADGNVYNFVTIGTQVWMAENLATTKYNDGTSIPLVTDNTLWSNLSTPGYCWYNNNETVYKDPYGALYNWYTINTNKLCPIGWHVPSDTEWEQLITFVSSDGHAGTEGTALKALSGWYNNGNGNDNYGFSALPGGYRWDNGLFYDIGVNDNWLSATELDATYGWGLYVLCSSANVYIQNYHKEVGFSVRCVRGY